MELQEKNILVGGVLCMFAMKTVEKNIPYSFIFLLHGRTGKKEDNTVFAKKIIQEIDQNIIVCLFDLPNHGINLQDSNSNQSWSRGNTLHAIDMYAQMHQTVKQISFLIDFSPVYLNVKSNNFGVVGISQGGHTALLAMTLEKRLNVCVSYISSGDYLNGMKIRYEKLKKKKSDCPSFESLVPENFKMLLQQYDPINNIKSFSHGNRPIYILNGDADRLVPMSSNEQFSALVAPEYLSESGNFKFDIIPDVGHEVTEAMKSAGIDWLRTHLRNLSSSAHL